MEKLVNRQKLMASGAALSLAITAFIGIKAVADKAVMPDCKLLEEGALRKGRIHTVQDSEGRDLVKGWDVYEMHNLGPQPNSQNTVKINHAKYRITEGGVAYSHDRTLYVHDFGETTHQQMDGSTALIDIKSIPDFPSSADFVIKVCK